MDYISISIYRARFVINAERSGAKHGSDSIFDRLEILVTKKGLQNQRGPFGGRANAPAEGFGSRGAGVLARLRAEGP